MKNRGNAFLIIISILGVFFTFATFLLRTTVEEKGATEFSLRGVQTQALAEAAMERAMSVLATRLNDPAEWKTADSIAVLLRQPMKVSGTTVGGLSDKLGKDEGLRIESPVAMVLKQEDLQKPDKNGKARKELDEMVESFTGGVPGSAYEVEVKVKLEKAFRIAPGPSVEGAKYKVPGVDCKWNCHSEVTRFLNNEGIVAIELKLPDSFKWLQLTVPIIGFDLTDLILDNICPQLKDYIYINPILEKLFPNVYPLKIPLAASSFPDLANKTSKVYNSALSPDTAVEKFGYLSFETKAKITYGDKKSVTRTISATKEFKCSDLEPVAPIYSFFLSNLKNELVAFSPEPALGGDFYVNNFRDFASILTAPPPDAAEKREFPGQIRVNGTLPMICNTSFVGSVGDPDLDGGGADEFLKKLFRGMEWLLVFDIGLSMDGVSTGQTVAYKKSSKSPTGIERVPAGATGGVPSSGGSSSAGSVESQNDTGKADKYASKNNKGAGGGDMASKIDLNIKDALKGLIPGISRPNIMLPLNASELGITVYEIFTHMIPMIDAWTSWEWPFMGRGLKLTSSMGEQFTIPLPGYISGLTHFFGGASLAPTMTKDIEGYVLKKYKQWHFGLVSFPLIPWPAGNMIVIPIVPPITLLPVFFPLWHTHDCVNKYEYNFYLFKPRSDESGPPDSDVRVYDPAFLENSPPNLYSVEQYAKKSSYFYPTAEDFYKDIPNRMVKVKTKDKEVNCFKLNGVTFISSSFQLPPPNWPEKTFYVSGKGMIVSGGNCFLRGGIEDPYPDEEEREAATPRTLFSLILRKGGLVYDAGEPKARIEGCLYTDKGIAITTGKALRIVGNWVTNSFSKATTAPNSLIMVDYTAYKTRSSLNSVHPEKGKDDPERYYLTLSPKWESWAVK